MSSDYKGRSPLHTACSTGGIDCIPILLEAGADINATNAFGATPMHEAFFYGNIEPVDAFMTYAERNPHSKPDGTLEMKNGSLAIESCMRKDKDEFLKNLLQRSKRLVSLGLQAYLPSAHNIERLLEHCL